jgi:restriction system protein
MSSPEHRISQDLRELVLRLPWWVSLLCALVSYLLLRPLAGLHAPEPSATLDTALSAFGQLTAGLAAVAQYLLPLAFLALAAVSAFLHWKRRDLHATLTFGTGGPGLRGLAREDVSFLVAAAYRARGFRVRQAEEVARRNGFDLRLDRGGERLLLQLRNWKSSAFDAGSLRGLFGALQGFRADRAVVLVSGRFTADAVAFAADKPIDLIDGRRFVDWVTARQPGRLAAIAEVVRSRRGAGGPTPGLTPPSAIGEEAGTADEQALGAALGALIRTESGPEEALGDTVRAVPRSSAPPPPRALAASGMALLQRAREGVRVARVANLIGMTLALGLGWVTYEWFNALPASPSATPWALLGRDNDQPVERYAALAAGIVSGERALPPLGQLDYGPEPARLLATAASASPEPAPVEEPVIEVFRSIRELEDAFNARYVPPPSCYDPGSPGGLASCGNHRIRARRAFIASNGRTMTPAPTPRPDDHKRVSPVPVELGAWGSSVDQGPRADGDQGSWRDAPAGGLGDARRQPWPDPAPGARPERSTAPATRTWRAEQDERDWSQGGRVADDRQQGTGSEPYPRSQPSAGWGQDLPPRVRRLPVDEWLPRPPPSVVTWRDEQQARDRRTQDDPGGWAQGSASDGADWPAPQPDAAVTEPAPDWREDWLRRY